MGVWAWGGFFLAFGEDKRRLYIMVQLLVAFFFPLIHFHGRTKLAKAAASTLTLASGKRRGQPGAAANG